MTGMTIVDGVPHIWGMPCTWDEAPPLLDCFSQWRCPHCSANLSGSNPICLNACHLTGPQVRNFQEQMRHISQRMTHAESRK